MTSHTMCKNGPNGPNAPKKAPQILLAIQIYRYLVSLEEMIQHGFAWRSKPTQIVLYKKSYTIWTWTKTYPTLPILRTRSLEESCRMCPGPARRGRALCPGPESLCPPGRALEGLASPSWPSAGPDPKQTCIYVAV